MSESKGPRTKKADDVSSDPKVIKLKTQESTIQLKSEGRTKAKQNNRRTQKPPHSVPT